MTIDRAALTDAVSEAFSPLHAQLCAKLLAEAGEGDTVPLLAAGRVLAAVAAELPGEPAEVLAAIDALSLVGADLYIGDQHAFLDADALALRPDIAPYIGNCAGDHLAFATVAGYDFPDLSGVRPVLIGFAAVQIGNALQSIFAELHYPATGGVVNVHYGAPAVMSAPRRTVREVTGDLLASIGAKLNAAGACPFTVPGVEVEPLTERGTVH